TRRSRGHGILCTFPDLAHTYTPHTQLEREPQQENALTTFTVPRPNTNYCQRKRTLCAELPLSLKKIGQSLLVCTPRSTSVQVQLMVRSVPPSAEHSCSQSKLIG